MNYVHKRLHHLYSKGDHCCLSFNAHAHSPQTERNSTRMIAEENTSSTSVIESFLFADRSRVFVAVEATLFVTMNVLSLCGNSIVCAAIYRCTAFHIETNILLVALGISDIMMLLLAMPLSDAAVITGRWPFGPVVCQVQGYFVHMFAFLSLHLMTLTAINRYLKVVRPSTYKKIFTRRSTILMIAVVCAITTGLIATLFFANSNSSSFVFHPGKSICVAKFKNIR